MKLTVATELEPTAWVAPDSKLMKNLPKIKKKLRVQDPTAKLYVDVAESRVSFKGKKLNGYMQFQPLPEDQATQGPSGRPCRSLCVIHLKLPFMWSVFEKPIKETFIKTLRELGQSS